MSALGQKQTLESTSGMSALPPESGHWNLTSASLTTRSIRSTNCYPGGKLSQAEPSRLADAHEKRRKSYVYLRLCLSRWEKA